MDRTLQLYGIVGDDIIIFDRLLAAKYLGIMNDVGIEISVAKSFYPRPLASGVGESTPAEFLAKSYYHGFELSRLPIALLSMESTPAAITQFWTEVLHRFIYSSLLCSRYLNQQSIGFLFLILGKVKDFPNPDVLIVVRTILLTHGFSVIRHAESGYDSVPELQESLDLSGMTFDESYFHPVTLGSFRFKYTKPEDTSLESGSIELFSMIKPVRDFPYHISLHCDVRGKSLEVYEMIVKLFGIGVIYSIIHSCNVDYIRFHRSLMVVPEVRPFKSAVQSRLARFQSSFAVLDNKPETF